MKKTGVIIARFQTPYLHEGHHQLIKYVKEKHNRVIAVLGITPVKGSPRNPLDFFTRERMVKASYPDLYIIPLADMRSDKAWSEKLDHLLRETFPTEHFVLYGSRDSFIPYYHGHFEVEELPSFGSYSATDLREQISDQVMGTEDFRSGIIYAAYNVYPKVYATVDIGLFRNNNTELLLGFRNAEGLWRLPGGFTDPTDENFEAAAYRELCEECGPLEVSPMTYCASFRISDWRYRKEQDQIISTLFKCELLSGEPSGSDDLDEVTFHPIEHIKTLISQNEIVPEHLPLLNRLLQR
jgi:bifunctional NMN adenylyltransferase/nudix hydrolase